MARLKTSPPVPLSLKELETMLWQHPATCEARGLAVGSAFYCAGRRYRALSLAPYGVAPLVNVRYWPAERRYYVQVFVLTTGSLNLLLYQRVKRYQTALRQALWQALRAAGLSDEVATRGVLVGRQVQRAGDFVFCLNHDATCQAYTYAYDPVGGVAFEPVGTNWQLTGSEHAPALAGLATSLLDERARALAEAAEQRELPEVEPRPETCPSSLVVTAEGILVDSRAQGGGQEDE